MPYVDIQKRRKYDVDRYSKNCEKIKEKKRRYYHENKERLIKQKNERYRTDINFRHIDNIRKITAHKYKFNSNTVCEVCGCKDQLNRHHIKYSTKLSDVIILCRQHHEMLHRNSKLSHTITPITKQDATLFITKQDATLF